MWTFSSSLWRETSDSYSDSNSWKSNSINFETDTHTKKWSLFFDFFFCGRDGSGKAVLWLWPWRDVNRSRGSWPWLQNTYIYTYICFVGPFKKIEWIWKEEWMWWFTREDRTRVVQKRETTKRFLQELPFSCVACPGMDPPIHASFFSRRDQKNGRTDRHRREMMIGKH